MVGRHISGLAKHWQTSPCCFRWRCRRPGAFLTILHARQHPPADRVRLTGRHGLAVDSDQGAEALPTGRVEVFQVRSQRRPCDHCKKTGRLPPTHTLPTRSPAPCRPKPDLCVSCLVSRPSIGCMRSPSGLPCPPLPPAPLATHSLPPALPCRCACSYPLLTVVGVAASTVVYCSYRALAHNPDVQ